MPGLLVHEATPIFTFLFLFDYLRLGIDRLYLVHVGQGCLEFRVRCKLFFGNTKELSNIDSLASVSIDDIEDTLGSDLVIFSGIVLLTAIVLHL